MKLVLSNAGLTPEDFNIVCFFLKSAYPGCERSGESLFFAEVSALEAEDKSYYEDMRCEATAIDYQCWRVLKICRDMLTLRGEEKNPGSKLKLVIQKNARERYDTFIERRYQNADEVDLLSAGDFQCPDSGFGIVAVWDIANNFLWFEVCVSQPWDSVIDEMPEETYSWCVSQGVSACETASEANEILYRAIGRDALIGGFNGSME